MGGPIPLGNVVAANAMNGIVVQDKASYFTTYNTFCGLAAFKDDPIFGNGQDGMLITSTGGNILIRTNVITRNGDDGIEVSGKAKDVRIAGNIIGLNTYGVVPMGNADNGVEDRRQRAEHRRGRPAADVQRDSAEHDRLERRQRRGDRRVGTTTCWSTTATSALDISGLQGSRQRRGRRAGRLGHVWTT